MTKRNIASQQIINRGYGKDHLLRKLSSHRIQLPVIPAILLCVSTIHKSAKIFL
ncbi:hypothetical protein FHW36_1011338 [Chitinophaga polysaccharea]|uniref:Uncharacterized protein n=1 Tax=Chitinophaga polysaccharea TaxID=1293035 RepID=A0A561Q4X8_9BACT|nr:hypothetical protein FHW36_1011338 [Chitinophaga polysaccharea]